MNGNPERDQMIGQWSKIAGLVYDANHDNNLRDKLLSGNDQQINHELEKYFLTSDDCSDFVESVGSYVGQGWWVGDIPEE